MKIIIIVLFIFVTSTSPKAQMGVTDTLVYLKSIVQNKAQYIGQPFSKLKDSLQIEIKFYFPFASLPYDKIKETSTAFAFCFPPTEEEIYLTYPHLEIYWQTHVDAYQSRTLRSQYRTVGWNTIISDHYSANLIADIKVRE